MSSALTETESIKLPYYFRPTATDTYISKVVKKPKPLYTNLIEGSGSNLIVRLLNIEHEIVEIKLNSETESFDEVAGKWSDSFIQLEAVQNINNYNAEVELPSDETISTVTHWINEAFAVVPDSNAPDIVPDGEGGLDIEWALPGKFISIHIDHSDTDLNRIFVKQGPEFYSKSLIPQNLKAELSA